uniref:Uncharacterized protein n=1 Tax=Rhizophora mucronata TaxID=61149 RepID=A0A2P2NPY1_RHIMU
MPMASFPAKKEKKKALLDNICFFHGKSANQTFCFAANQK